MSPFPSPVDVAVGVLYDQSGRVLIARRPAGKPFPGLWEFPGGKVEAGEAPEHALARELDEELGIRVMEHRPLITFVHGYQDSPVRLWVYEVLAYEGRPEARDHQAVQWTAPEELGRFDMPAANAAVKRAVALPRLCLITDVQQFGRDRTLARLERHVERVRVLVVVREKTMDRPRLESLLEDMTRITRPRRCPVCVHADCDLEDHSNVDGVHWPASALASGGLPSGHGLRGVSCHSVADLRAARGLDADYAFLSPVRRTASHPDAQPLGWDRFAAMCREAGLPVYALGGMQPGDFQSAVEHDAQGIAVLSSAWTRLFSIGT